MRKTKNMEKANEYTYIYSLVQKYYCYNGTKDEKERKQLENS